MGNRCQQCLESRQEASRQQDIGRGTQRPQMVSLGVGVSGSLTRRLTGSRPTLDELRALNVASDEETLHKTADKDASGTPSIPTTSFMSRALDENPVIVCIRARPLSKKERQQSAKPYLKYKGLNQIVLKGQPFTFDCIFQEEASQTEVFDRTARPVLRKALEGYNGCVIAYGQTGSGKTYTMQGEQAPDAARGIIPLLCEDLFCEIQRLSIEKTIDVACSLMEIYNEHLTDLLAKGHGQRNLQIREDIVFGRKRIFVDGLSELRVNDAKAVLETVAAGQERRKVGRTDMNEHSSRSHAVLTFRISVRNNDDPDGMTKTVSKLHLLDLAGSERAERTGATGDRLKEAAQINLSLSCLGNVINALTSGKKGHIPYRDAKLTRLLEDSLGGNSYTVMICNISPADKYEHETKTCLDFAERAKKVVNVLKVNRDPKADRIAQLLDEKKALQAKITRLEEHVARLEANY